VQFLADENSKQKFRCHGYSNHVRSGPVARWPFRSMELTRRVYAALGTGLLWGYGLSRRGYILLCHTKVINRHVTESEDMLLLFRQVYNAYP